MKFIFTVTLAVISGAFITKNTCARLVKTADELFTYNDERELYLATNGDILA